MESTGTSTTIKPEENSYHNEAFSSDDVDKKSSSNINIGNGDTVPGETLSTKRESSTVEFTLPSKRVSKDRLQSIATEPYRGMGKEELLRFSSKPLWRNLRYVCITIVLTGWLALLITVVALVLTYPACRVAQGREWWQKAVIYRVYVRSFRDTNGDGIGDINGIREKLEYIKSLGVDTISLSPIYKLSKNATTDTHIVNHTKIDLMYGSPLEFKLLVNETHEKGMYIILDFIPNHTSNEHPWFLASKNNSDVRSNDFRSYYVWASGRQSNHLQEPNNWKTVPDCSPAWTYLEGQHYLHQFMASLPDLNLRSTKVRDALKDILKFWLDLGVDGFYVRDADYLFEDYDLRDEDANETSACKTTTETGNSYHKYTRGLSEVFDMLARWRAFLNEYGNTTNRYRILFADVDGPPKHVMDYYGLFNRDGVDFPLNKFSLQLNMSTSGEDIKKMVSVWMDNLSKNHWPNWMVGNDRSERLVERLGEIAGPFLILTMLLPGTPYFYYGDEIGLRSVNDSTNGTLETSMALPMRGPMPWDNKTWSGGQPWMVINPEYKNQMNVEAQKNNPESLWNLFTNLTTLRKDKPSFEYGDYIAAIQDNDVFSFVREYDGEKGYLVALNFAGKRVHKHYSGVHKTIPGGGKVEIVTGKNALHSKGGSADLNNLALAAYEGIVVSWDYQAKEL